MTMRNPSASIWRAFLRHRYRIHVEVWLAVAVGLLWGYYIDLYAHEPLWAVLPAAYIGAFFVVAVLVSVAAILRFPWWGLAPLCLLSMMLEWFGRRLCKRPWRRKSQPRERFLSNPFTLWQSCQLRRRRKPRVAPPVQALTPQAMVTPFNATALSHRMRSRPARSEASWIGVGEYLGEAFEAHWKFWVYSSPVWICLWLWLITDMNVWAAAIVAVIMWLVFSVVLVIPLLAALLALISTLLFAASMTPRQRIEAAATLRQVKAVERVTIASPPTPAVQKSSWIWPLLIGLWIGHAWGDDQ